MHKKWNFSLSIFSVNASKSEGNCRFGHIYWRKPSWKTSFFVQWNIFCETVFLYNSCPIWIYFHHHCSKLNQRRQHWKSELAKWKKLPDVIHKTWNFYKKPNFIRGFKTWEQTQFVKISAIISSYLCRVFRPLCYK